MLEFIFGVAIGVGVYKRYRRVSAFVDTSYTWLTSHTPKVLTTPLFEKPHLAKLNDDSNEYVIRKRRMGTCLYLDTNDGKFWTRLYPTSRLSKSTALQWLSYKRTDDGLATRVPTDGETL